MAVAELNSLLEVDDYSDPEDFVDDITDEELLADLLEKEPSTGIYEERCVMVWGIPVIDAARLPKLKNVLSKVFGLQKASYVDEYPLDEKNQTKGYCFIEYQNKEAAEAARILIDNFNLDKNHTFSAYSFSSLRNLEQPDDNWKVPDRRTFTDVGDLWWWAQNSKCQDLFAIQVQNPKDGTIALANYWNHNGTEVSVCDEGARENWSESIFKWSPYGTYLASFHKMGIALWAGEKFTKVQRFSHENVEYIEFSPCESYLVTYSCNDRRGATDMTNSLRIFDVFTGELKKTFSPSNQGQGAVNSWPFIKWSHDEKYFGFCRPKGNTIFIYDTETFTLNQNKTVELDGLVTFEWNPSKNMFAYYCEERPAANAPAEIGVVEFPSREKIRAQRIFSVSCANLFWQKAGNYLAAHTERYNSMRKNKDGAMKLTGVASHLEIFDFTSKLIAVQTMQLAEPFVSFGWEPKGDRFCVLQGSSNKTIPCLYKIEKDKPTPQVLARMESGIQLNTVSWAPQGGYLTVYGNGSTAGNVFFIDVNGSETTKTKTVEHPNLNYCAWDPTGRYFVTGSFHSRHDASYRIHSFQGRELYKKSIETIMRFRWRPRPPVHLTEQKQKEIKRNLKITSQKFEEEDRREQQKLSKELVEKRRIITKEFEARRKAHKEAYEKEKSERVRLRRGIDTDKPPSDTIEEEVTVLVSSEKTEVKSDE
ncbi:unnamed protein product [Bursaphelenchus okinawaensis]|uniref:Eukaryotic translation initiation factor 3 subunit B n=1 Tax=Bursaphelenchus okinawaensis TaxID=465554 RepID=A0A811K9M3_9BILA|nr:unnamed protein product [Bursaphelenchus okinawaensis]CAG9094965.1 unnamed protein product [Bursaphelenchus okinawaensis]